MSFRISTVFVGTFLILQACGGGKEAASESPGESNQPVATSVDPATAGAVKGTVKFTGAKPAPKKIIMTADAYCKSAHAGTVLSDDVVVNKNGTLKNVLVYVKSGLEGKTFPPSGSVVLNQVGCMYSPHVVAVQAGQELVIRNEDSVLHNINARPKKNKPFNIGQPVKGMESKKTLANSEIGIPVKCDVHPWMKSYINVLPNPYFAVTGDQGSFDLKNLPPGNYVIEAWHEKYGTATQKVTVGAKQTKTVRFSFHG